MNKYLSMDIGGTVIKCSLMDENYNFLKDVERPTKKDPAEFLMQLKDIVNGFKDGIKGIAVCMAGFIDPVTGVNSDFSVGKNFKAYNLKRELSEASGLPVVLENDSDCAGLGEMVLGAGKEFKDFFLITIGTGLGAAVIINRKLLRGSHFKAGEVGFCRLICDDVNDEYSNAGATSRLVKEVSECLGKTVDGIYIFDHLDDERIFNIYKRWIKKLAVIIGNAASVLDPEAILIGGGVSVQERFIKDLSEATYSYFDHLSDYTKIIPCKTGNKAGRIGALSLLLNK